MDSPEESARISQSSNQSWLSLCSSCGSRIHSILSIGEPSYLGELFEESFDTNHCLKSPSKSKDVAKEIELAKEEILHVQNPKVNAVSANGEHNGIDSLVRKKTVEVPPPQKTTCLDEHRQQTISMLENVLVPPDIVKGGRIRRRSPCNMKNDGDKNDDSEGPSKCKLLKLNDNISHTSGDKNSFNISNIIQNEMKNEEAKNLIEEFRKECDEILDPVEFDTLPSIEQFKTNVLESSSKFSGTGKELSKYKTIRRTDASVGGLVLSTFTNTDKRSILDLRKKILLMCSRLTNLTGYINNTANMTLGQTIGINICKSDNTKVKDHSQIQN